MAGNKSSEEKKAVRTGKDERTGTWYVEYEDGTRRVALSPVEGCACGNNEVKLSDSEKPGDLSIKVNIDVSDALKGLKAVQREARKSTVALKELEEQQKEGLTSYHNFTSNRKCKKCGSEKRRREELINGNGKVVSVITECLDCRWAS